MKNYIKNYLIALVSILFLALPGYSQTPTVEKATVTPSPTKKNHAPLKKKSKPSAKIPTTAVSETKPNPSSIPPWTKEWTAKYVMVTPKSGYIHVLIDTDTLRSTFEGPGMHLAAALEALRLSQTTDLLEPATDLVKLDVVLFLNKDNYGSPVWDSMKPLAHFEFSAKSLSKNTESTFQKPEAEWKGLFQTVKFY